MGNIFSQLSQIYFVPTAPLTEKNCPDQEGRVFLVAGGYAGVGFELCKILYAHNARVCIAGRAEAKAREAMKAIRKESPNSAGQLDFLHLDLSDLSTIKPAVHTFTDRYQRLDVLLNNAGVMFPPAGSTSAQGHELQIATNCLGPYLLYRLLEPLLAKTAASSPTASVRVAWAASIAVEILAPQPHGVVLDDAGCPTIQGVKANYGQSKAGNVFLAREGARATKRTGVVHVAFNPGNLRTELQRHWNGLDAWLLHTFVEHPPIYGAYTELWTVLTPELTPEKSGAYVYPWGRFGSLPAGIESASKLESEAGLGIAAKFVEWCDKQMEPFY